MINENGNNPIFFINVQFLACVYECLQNSAARAALFGMLCTFSWQPSQAESYIANRVALSSLFGVNEGKVWASGFVMVAFRYARN